MPIVCGYYRKTPAEVADLTRAEVEVMLEGIDWMNDREWERALFQRAGDHRAAQRILDLSYPHFRVDPVVSVIESEPAAASEPKRMNGNG